MGGVKGVRMLSSRSFFLASCFIASAALLTAGGCNSSPTPPSEDKGLIGAGSTFINPIMTHWIADFQSSRPGVEINYQSIGSGGGIQQLKKGLVDFGASDAPLDDERLKDMPALVQIPASAGPVCITYNLPDLKSPLRLSPTVLAGIYLGTIKTWQDPEIRKDNPGANLPKTGVIVAHRSDGSGTTNIFTTYLAAVSPEWEKKVGKGLSVSWPAGVGGKGSEGVTGSVKQMQGAIGYVELSYATENKLPVAEIRNAAGEWIAPTVAGATAAIDAFRDQLAQDIRTPVVNPLASAKDAYPISGLTYLLIPKQGKTPQKEEIVKEFVQYIITSGQAAAEGLQYAKLPQSLVSHADKLLGELQTSGPQQTSKNLQPNR
jgi:phosphate transport system substrate-binding protein